MPPAFLGLADRSTKHRAVCMQHTRLFVFFDKQFSIFNFMLITITRACVHFNFIDYAGRIPAFLLRAKVSFYLEDFSISNWKIGYF